MGKQYRRPAWIYFNFVAVIFLAAVALAACEDENRNGDGAAPNQTPISQAAGSDTSAVDDPDPLKVAVSLAFFPSMVEAVGGDRVEVMSIVPLGVDVETYQPSPRDAQTVADADLVLVNGLALEAWLEALIESAGGVEAPLIELADGLQENAVDTDELHDDDAHDDAYHDDDDGHNEDDHDHAYGNPHFWLSPAFGIHYVERIAEALIEKDPANEDYYRSNADAYIEEIEEFDEWAQEQMAQIPEENRKMVTFHDAFPYFADHYGLDVVGVIIRSPGRETGAQALARLADEIQAVGVPAIFIEPQFNPQLAEAIADEAGVRTQMLYSDTPPEGAGYLEMLRLNVERVVEGLS